MKNMEKIDLKSKNSEKNKTDLSQFALHRTKSHIVRRDSYNQLVQGD